MSKKTKKWYRRTHDFAPYTRADGQAVSDEFDAIQASFEKIPAMREDGLGFAESPIIPEPTEDNHPVPFHLLKTAERSVYAAKERVETLAQQVADNNNATEQNTRSAIQANQQATQSQQLASQSATQATEANKQAQQAKTQAQSQAQTATSASSSAQQSATQASESENLAHKWAANPVDEQVQGGKFSAYHYATKARLSAERAENIADGRKDWSDIDNVPISTDVNDNSKTNLASAFIVKTAYDKAVEAKELAERKQSPATTLAGYGITDFQLSSATGNLNDYRTAGIYSFNSISNSQNRPSRGFTGNLQVITGGAGNEGWCHQIFYRHYSDEVYERHQLASNTDAWSEWKKVGSDGVPVGSVVAFPKEIANPQGFLRCDGTTFAQSTYPDLYRVLGNKNKLPKLNRSDVGQLAYFAVDNIPDGWIAFDSIRSVVNETSYPELYRYLIGKYRSISNVPLAEDRFIRNAGNGLGVGDKQEDEIKAHNHTTPYSIREQVSYRGRTNDRPISQLNIINNQDGTARESTSDTGGSETRPKSIIFKLCIKAKNSFDDVQFWIKAFGEVTNAGTLDAGRLAQNLQDKADRAHTHTVSQIADFAQGVAGQFNYQEIGNFTIRKFPDGTMLQTYVYEVNDLREWEEKNFTWAVAFSERPLIIGNITSSANRSTDQGINILSKSTATAVYYHLYEHWNGDQGLCRIQFFAIGRWF